MTDKLNNLVETDKVELGGYYKAGDNPTWDMGLTKGQLYLITEIIVENIDFRVTGDDGIVSGIWIAMDCIAAASERYPELTHGKLYRNPANVG